MENSNDKIQAFSGLQLSGMRLLSAKSADSHHPINYLLGFLRVGQTRFKVGLVWQKVD